MGRIGAPEILFAKYTGSIPKLGTSLKAAVRSKWMVWGVLTLLVVSATGVIAALLIQQDVGISGSSQNSPIQFVDGLGGVTGFASITVGSSGASATIALAGVAGAALMQVSDLLHLENTEDPGGTSYTVTLGHSGSPATEVDSLLFTVLDGTTVEGTYDVTATSPSASFIMAPGDVFEIQIDLVVADGTSLGFDLGDVDLKFDIVPV